MATAVLSDDEPAFRLGPGLYYVSRGDAPQMLYRLDASHLPNVPRPDRDVLKALLRYASDGLDEQS
ncbi:hypothetical protein [Roseateles sp.]|uniref:hypothetical protein n=1 Tax=Roseateles sp. TaxID=1971397 RepID=UPI002F40B157